MKKHILTAYRTFSFAILISIFFGILWYAITFLLLIDGVSKWAAPLVLSPTQERVLTFQPQVANLEAALIKQKIELETAQSTYRAAEAQLQNISALQNRLVGASKQEANQANSTSAAINNVLTDKRFNIADTEAMVSSAREMLKAVNDELAAKLITKDQADARRIQLQSALNNATDAKSQAIAMQYQAQQLRSGAGTLAGGASSLTALTSVKMGVELQALNAQLSIQSATSKATIEGLQKILTEGERVLAVAKESPYYLALRNPVSVAFVPYSSFMKTNVGDSVYDCALVVMWCSKVGQVTKMYDAEEYARHPIFKTDLKGHLVSIEYTDITASKSQVVFLGRAPLWF